MPLRLRLSLGLALLALASAACAWSVPADPGKNAALRARPDSVSAGRSTRGEFAPRQDRGEVPTRDSTARAIYLERCSKCHEPFPPSHASADEWPALVRKYGPRAGLFGGEREGVLRWLQENAR